MSVSSNRVNRAAHQPPTKPIAFEEPSAEELFATCGNLAALVLARDAGMTPLSVVEEDGSVTACAGTMRRGSGEEAVTTATPRPLQLYRGEAVVARTVSLLQSCGFADIQVSVAPEIYDDVVEWLCVPPSHPADELLAEAGKACDAEAEMAFPTVSAYDARADYEATREHGNFELFNLGFGTLMQARDMARDAQADGVLVVPCDLANLKARHILQLARALKEHSQAEAIASWAVWLNRPPYLLRASFLEGLEESPRCRLSAKHAGEDAAYQPLPQLNVHEVVFGEEMLMATPPASKPEDAFFQGCTLSALEAVRAARAEKAEMQAAQTPEDLEALEKRREAARVAAQRNAAYLGMALSGGPNEADDTLMRIAREVLTRMDAVRTALEESGCQLDRWDTWAHRNKLDFPIFSDPKQERTLVYLDSGATTQRLGRALDAQYRFDAFENANIYRGAYALSAKATSAFNEARSVVERHLHAERRSVIFTANTSAGAALVAQAWGERNIGADDRIVMPASEHHSNLVPWLMLAQRKGAQIDYVPLRDDGSLDLDAYRALLAKKPKLVCVAHVSNVLGLLNPVEEMARAAHEVGALVYVDAAQSFAHVTLDVRSLGADFLSFSAHKAYGPMGLGCLWVSAEAFDQMDPTVGGGGTVSHVGLDSYYLRGQAIQYELGTPPVSQAIGFAAAVRYLDELGMEALEAHDAALTRYLVAGFRALDDTLGGVRIWGNHECEAGLVGPVAFSLTGIPAKSAASVLGKLGVCVRAGGHCTLPLHASLGLTGSVRFSFGAHTTLEDIEAGLVALAACRHAYGNR